MLDILFNTNKTENLRLYGRRWSKRKLVRFNISRLPHMVTLIARRQIAHLKDKSFSHLLTPQAVIQRN